jgi:hypothetical protein
MREREEAARCAERCAQCCVLQRSAAPMRALCLQVTAKVLIFERSPVCRRKTPRRYFHAIDAIFDIDAIRHYAVFIALTLFRHFAIAADAAIS